MTKVLIVEDNLSIVRVTRILLEREGFEVQSCADEGCFDLVRSWKPSIILMDVRLPDLNGIEACLQLKRDEATSSIPVILVSADGDIEELAAEACADGILPKPFSNRALIDTIRTYAVDSAVS